MDKVFEPLLKTGGPLAGSVGQIIGVGAGRGAGLLFICAGLIIVLVSAIGYLSPSLRRVEDELPEAVTRRPVRAEADPKPLMPLPATD
jgi:DHA3 family macrolide efflux protein-like MFS transporter